MSHNLVQRRRGWYAQLNVPKDVQTVIGLQKFRQSLKTRDRDQAKIDAGPIISNWRQKIADARTQTETDVRHERWATEGRPRRRAPVEEPEEDENVRVRRLQIALRDAKTPEEKEGIDLSIDDWITDVASTYRDWSKENQKTGDIPEVRELATKIFAQPTLDYIDAWIAQLEEEGLKPKTIQMSWGSSWVDLGEKVSQRDTQIMIST